MVQITYIEFNGVEHQVDVPSGFSVMEGATRNNIPGIDADCGGACACATCHVYVDDAWRSKTGDRSEAEAGLLEFADGADARSRLSCQIKVSEALDGLVVQMPERQG
jgi:2Fe-2S ferredoxin